MRQLTVTAAEIQLKNQVNGFQALENVVAVNLSGASITLQESDTTGAGFVTLATVPAGTMANVKLNRNFLKLSAAGNLNLLSA